MFLLVYNFVCSDVIVRSIRKVIGHGRPLFYKYGHKPQEKETLRTKKKKRGADNLFTQELSYRAIRAAHQGNPDRSLVLPVDRSKGH